LLLPGQLAVKLADSRPVNVIVQLPAVSVPLQVFPLVLSVTVTTVLPVKAALLVVSSHGEGHLHLQQVGSRSRTGNGSG